MSNEELTAQGIFDQVVEHLRDQGVASINAELGICAYRSPEGFKCAIGAVLTDEEYVPSMEGKSVEGLIRLGRFPLRLVPVQNVLNDLQNIHDRYDPDKWENEFRVAAIHHGLTYTPDPKERL